MGSNFELPFFAATESGSVPESAHGFLSSVPNHHESQFYTLVSARNVLVPTESLVHEANCGQQSEKMGSIPLTYSLRDSKSLAHISNNARVSASSFLQLCWLQRFEVFVSHSIDSAALSYYQSIRMSCQCSVLILLVAFYTPELQVLLPATPV